MAMEDFRVDVVVGKGRGDVHPLDLSPFTLVGATTRSGLLPGRCATGSLRQLHGFLRSADLAPDRASLRPV